MLTTATLLEALAAPADQGPELRPELACPEFAARSCYAGARLANRLAVVMPRLDAVSPQSEAVRLALGVILALHRVEVDAVVEGEAPL